MPQWVKNVLIEAGVDTIFFIVGSTRAAATSKATASGAAADDITKCVSLSKASTFRNWYKEPIQKTNALIRDAILKWNLCK